MVVGWVKAMIPGWLRWPWERAKLFQDGSSDPKDGSRGSRERLSHPEMAQLSPGMGYMAPRDPRDESKWPWDGLNGAEDGLSHPRMAQTALGMGQVTLGLAKVALGWLRWPQEWAMTCQEGSAGPGDGPSGHEDGSRHPGCQHLTYVTLISICSSISLFLMVAYSFSNLLGTWGQAWT